MSSNNVIVLSYADRYHKPNDAYLYKLNPNANINYSNIRDIIISPIDADIPEEFELFKSQVIPAIEQALENHGNRLFIYFIGNLFQNPHDTETNNPCGQLLEYLFGLIKRVEQFGDKKYFGVRFVIGSHEQNLYEKGITTRFNIVSHNDVSKYTFSDCSIVANLNKNELIELVKRNIFYSFIGGNPCYVRNIGQNRDIMLSYYPLLHLDSHYRYEIINGELKPTFHHYVSEHEDLYYKSRNQFKELAEIKINFYASEPCFSLQEQIATVDDKCSFNINSSFIRNDKLYVPSQQKNVVYIFKYALSEQLDDKPLYQIGSPGSFYHYMSKVVQPSFVLPQTKPINPPNVTIEKPISKPKISIVTPKDAKSIVQTQSMVVTNINGDINASKNESVKIETPTETETVEVFNNDDSPIDDNELLTNDNDDMPQLSLARNPLLPLPNEIISIDNENNDDEETVNRVIKGSRINIHNSTDRWILIFSFIFMISIIGIIVVSTHVYKLKHQLTLSYMD